VDNPNDKMAEQMLEAAYPGLAHIQRMMDKFDVQYEDILDYLYALKMIKTHGFGIVQTHINAGQIVKMEATMRTIKRVESVHMVDRRNIDRERV
jgi:hypothetical protein